MWLGAFFRAFYRTVRASIEQARLEREQQFQAIELTELGHALYFRFPRHLVRFGYSFGETVGGVDLSLADARALVESIELACRQNDVVSVDLREFSLRIDARVKDTNSNSVTVWIGYSSLRFGRARLLAGCNEFSDVFGSASGEGLHIATSDRNGT